jgi:hypothetical protein
MASRWGVLAIALAVAASWLVFSQDPARERIIRSVGDLASRAVTSRSADPNWGDVAKRIGDFAAEERGLKDSVGRAENATPPIGR